jgi:hypothetical protein
VKREVLLNILSITKLMPPEVMPTCRDREILRARMRADLKVYGESVRDLQRSLGEEFEKVPSKGGARQDGV